MAESMLPGYAPRAGRAGRAVSKVSNRNERARRHHIFWGVHCPSGPAATSQAKTLKILFEAVCGLNELRIVSKFRKTYVLQHWRIKGFHKIEYLGRY